MSLNRLLVTLVRHGESQDNQQGVWAGFRDTPLTINGVSQARALGQSFANVPLTAIYCSDLKRAAMTAEEILKSNRSIPPPPLVQSKSLREINFGQAEGQSYASSEWLRGSSGDDARNFKFQEGESLEEVNARIAKAVRQFILPRIEALRKKPPSQQEAAGDVGHICIVAHGIAIAELLRVFMALHHDSASAPWPDPKSSYQRVRLENTGWSRLEVAVPFQGDDEVSPGTGSSSSVPTVASASDSVSTTNASGSAQTTTGKAGYTDFGEMQTDLVEGPVDALQKLQSSSSDIPTQSTLQASEASSRPIYVRVLTQNQTDHLRGFVQSSSTSSAAKTVAHLAGGGAAKSSSGSSPAPGAATCAAVVGLPASATLASIASHATSSQSHSNAAMTPSTPATAASINVTGTGKVATPASARSLSAYDARSMARELERAGAASTLIGSEGTGYYTSSGSVPTLSGDRQASISGAAGALGASNTSPAVGGASTATHTAGAQGGTTVAPGSILFSAASNAVAGATSPNPTGSGFPAGPGAFSDTWQIICIRVLPLFNGEALRTSIEDLNEMVTLHVRKTIERSPAHAIESLTLDLISLTSTGTLTLNSKLQGLEDSRLLLRLVEVWTFFLGQVLPYCEGCFLPLQTDSTLRSLMANNAANGSSTGPFILSGAASAGIDLRRIEVRRVLLVVFRDQVLMPIYERLLYLFAHLSELDPAFSAAEDTTSAGGGDDGIKQVSLRLLQMTSVLASILSEDDAQDAMDNLLRGLRLGSKSAAVGRGRGAGDKQAARSSSPTFKNNRRGWMAQKARKHGPTSGLDIDPHSSHKGSTIFGSGSAMGGTDAMQSGPDGYSTSAQRGFLARPSHLTNIQDPLDPRYGTGMTEDEYLTSLRSPAGSPAISTPGNSESASTPAPDQSQFTSRTESAAAATAPAIRSENEDGAATTPMASQRASLQQESESALAAPPVVV